MLKNLYVRNKKVAIGVIVAAILIPLVLFATASIYNPSNKKVEATPTPVEEIPTTPTEQEETVYDMELQVGQPVNIPESNVELLLVSTENQEQEGCFDCISSTIIEVTSRGETEVWDYSCGGFSGECNYEFEAFNYLLEAQEVKETSMTVKVYPN